MTISWCPWYPSMFFGSYTLYYAQKKDTDLSPVCRQEFGPLTGPNNLSCGCPNGGCIDIFSILNAFGRRYELDLDFADPHSGCVPESQSHSHRRKSAGYDPAHHWHDEIVQYGCTRRPDLTQFPTAKGVTALALPDLVFYRSGNAGIKFLAKVFKVSFDPANFHSKPHVDDPSIDESFVGYVSDANYVGGTAVNADRVSKYGQTWVVKYTPAGVQYEVNVVGFLTD